MRSAYIEVIPVSNNLRFQFALTMLQRISTLCVIETRYE